MKGLDILLLALGHLPETLDIHWTPSSVYLLPSLEQSSQLNKQILMT